MSSKLTLQDAARFVPHKLKAKTDNIVRDVVLCPEQNLTTVTVNNLITGIGHKLIMRHINTLTQPTWLEGYAEPVIPLIELAKLSCPFETFEHEIIIDDYGIDSDISINLFDKNNDRVLWCFTYNTFHNCFITDETTHYKGKSNQTELWGFMEKHKFNAWGIPDELVVYASDEFNPYKP